MRRLRACHPLRRDDEAAAARGLLAAVSEPTSQRAGEGEEEGVTELQAAVAKAAVAALVDTLAQVEQDRKNVRYLTVELELKNGVPVDGRAWIERGINLRRLLEGRG